MVPSETTIWTPIAQTLGFVLLLSATSLAQTTQEAEPIEALAARAEAEVAKQKTSITRRIKRAIDVFTRDSGANGFEDIKKQRRRIEALGRAAVDDLIKHLSSNQSVRVQSEVTELLRTALKGGALPRHSSALLSLAESKDSHRAAAAWSILGSTADARLISPARAAAATGSAPAVRAAALLALAELKDPDAAELWAAALGSPEPAVREAALDAISLAAEVSLLKATVKAVADGVPAVSLAALKALGSFRDSIDAIRKLHSTLELRDQVKIGAALTSLERIDKRELSGKYLRDCVSRQVNSYAVRYQAAQVLKRMGDDFGMLRLASPLKKQITKQPRELAPRRALGELYFNFGEYSRALKELERFMTGNPPFTERYAVNLMLAKAYATLRQYKKAGTALAGAGRGFDWSEFASVPEFAEMVKSKAYARYFNQ